MARWSARADWRLWLALLASLLTHLLWLTPGWSWLPAPAHDDAPAAPLTARLQVLAAPTAVNPASAPAASPAQPLAQLADGQPPVARSKAKPAQAPPPSAEPGVPDDVASDTMPPAPAVPEPAEPAPARPASAAAQFPARISLRYEVFYGSLMAGIGELEWQGGDGRYRLEMTLRSLFAPRLRYVSEGELNGTGLKPLRFDAYRGDTRREHAEFDWAAGELRYGDRDAQRAELQPGAQDILSLVFQLALRAGALEGQTVQITSGKKVYSQPVRIDGESEQNLAGQTLAVVQVSSEARGQRTDVWLAREQHNLPLRIRNSGGDKLIDQRVIRVQVDGETILERPEPERIHHGH